MDKKYKRKIPKRRCFTYRSKAGKKRGIGKVPNIYIDIGFWPPYKAFSNHEHTKIWFEIRFYGYGIDLNYGTDYETKLSKFWAGDWFYKHYL